MEHLSKITKSEKPANSLVHPPFFRDHHVDGKPVLPAVEAMESLAACTAATFPGTRVSAIAEAAFDKFLFLDPGKKNTTVHNRLDQLTDGTVRATLQTRSRAPKAAITRTKIHAFMGFGLPGKPPPDLPLDIAASLAGICRTVDPKRLYAELVPFGGAYRNIIAPLLLSDDGAMAHVGSPRQDGRRQLVLGSPYPLDGAFHAACAWAQYACGSVAFPVAVDFRSIVRPTRLDETYVARVVPIAVDAEPLVFDIFLFDQKGNLREVAAGVRMRDISGGRTRPPGWIQKTKGPDPLAHIKSGGHTLAVIERLSLAPFCGKTLSQAETRRYTPMATTRQNSFVAARMALKRLSRALSRQAHSLPPEDIDTVQQASPRPRCPVDGRQPQPFCSVSHDNRFAVAVVADTPVGIDVEQVTGKALQNSRLFTDASETKLIHTFSKGAPAAAVRVWSAKEAVAKALDIPLARAWQRARITALGQHESRLQIEDMGSFNTAHDTVDDHLFTLIKICEEKDTVRPPTIGGI